jgi:Helix-turn-helix domain
MRTKSRPNGKFLTIRQAEAEYAIPYHRLYRWVERGLLARLSQDVTGEAIYIKRTDLEAFLDSNMVGERS